MQKLVIIVVIIIVYKRNEFITWTAITGTCIGRVGKKEQAKKKKKEVTAVESMYM